MRDEERRALARVQFNTTVRPDDVWSPLTSHVPELHQDAAGQVLDWFAAADRRDSPTGIVLEGYKGVGKTHLLRWLRQEVQARGGWFFLLKFLEGREFWHSVLHGFRNGFFPGQGDDQLTPLLKALCDKAGIRDPYLRQQLCGPLEVSRAALDAFVAGLEHHDRRIGRECADTARALALYRSHGDAGTAGDSYFALDGGVDQQSRDAWGLREGARQPQELISELSRLIALVGPALVAVDQLDSLMVQARPGSGGSVAPPELVNQVADGLMELREWTDRTLPVVACIPATWDLIRRGAVGSAADRYTVVQMQGDLPRPDVARALVAAHLRTRYAELAFVPPHPTWPVADSAFNTLDLHHTPRQILDRVSRHVRWCLESDEVVELTSFGDDAQPPRPRPATDGSLAELDATFERYRREAAVEPAVSAAREDEVMPQILEAGLTAFVLELGEDRRDLAVDPPPGRKPALHARLRRTVDERTEDEIHWSFRAIASTHHNAVLSRLRNARIEAGHQDGMDKRKLVVLRNTGPSRGPVTTATINEFEAAGGRTRTIGDEDIRTFHALDRLLDEHRPALLPWLASRRPAGRTELFRKVFLDDPDLDDRDDPPDTPDPPDVPDTPDGGAAADPPVASGPAPSAGPDEPVVPVGIDAPPNRRIEIPLRALRQHTVAFAGSGSGKTVLLRRLIEECALRGVSAIVLDPNNDLARLGDEWPTAPDGWSPGDAELAARYHRDVEVVVWTPCKQQGRPLVLRPLPDFGGIDDPEEFGEAVVAATAGLLPRARLAGAKAETSAAVLQQAVEHYAQAGGRDIAGLIALLEDLPADVSTLRNGTRLAAEMAEKLKAVIVREPLLRAEGVPLDPATLLTPSPSRRARVSVISMIGLPEDGQRQTFVSQLQLALFAWIKKNPAGDRPLGGLLVMDEAQDFAPSGAATASTESTLKLSAQARKYGLGLVFATQAPRGIHNRIPGNAATQFFGRLTAGVQIAAAEDLAKRKGGDVDDISRLTSGQFYAAPEGMAFTRLRMPMCLSHHPSSALTDEEVLERARRPTAEERG